MSKIWKILVVLILLLILVWWWRGGSTRPPDQRLADRFDDLCQIAADHVDKPKRGVEKYFAYLGKHSPEMMRLFGDMLVVVERIPDDAAHDERAVLAARRLHKVLDRCDRTMNDFQRAVESDPDAHALYRRGVERLGRTLRIIGGADPEDMLGGAAPFLLGPAAR